MKGNLGFICTPHFLQPYLPTTLCFSSQLSFNFSINSLYSFSSSLMSSIRSVKLGLVFVISIFTLQFYVSPSTALNVGISLNGALDLGKRCSRTCESKFCKVAPFLRYGKYCGLLYSGCPGEQPCDGLDACCLSHDKCIKDKNDDYLSESCNQNFLNCVHYFQKSRAPTFRGNTCDVKDVVKIIEDVMAAAIAAGKVLGKP